jgi:chorismate synthase
LIANACFSIGGVKGIEFGKGFGIVNETGKTFNDELYYENNKVYTKTNNNSGINGGITNSMPVVFNLAIKPTPSISIPQDTIDFVKKENTTISITGRHDPAIIRRIGIVIDNLMAIVIADMLYSKYGCYFLNFEVK